MYHRPRDMQTKLLINNIQIPDIKSIGIMKVELIGRRGKFRDYYDIYAITQEGVRLSAMIQGAVDYSGNRFKVKTLEAFLCDSKRYTSDKKFTFLKPKYKITGEEIESKFVKMLREENNFHSLT